MSLSKSLPPSPQQKQIHYITNLRTTLTTLVLLHHTASTYGGTGRTTYQSSLHPQSSSLILTTFNTLNQSFFMGTYFYLAGHFSRKSLESKGRKQFLEERVKRLGLPTVLYTIFGGGFVAGWERWWFFRGDVGVRWFFKDWLPSLKGIRGPVWFLGTLLVFDTILAGVWKKPNPAMEKSKGDENIHPTKLLSAIGLLSLAESTLRTFYPIGTIFTPLKLNIGYLGQYIATYTFGVLVPCLETAIPSQTTSLTLTSTALFLLPSPSSPSFPAFSYALSSNITGYLLGSSMLSYFKEHFNNPWDTKITDNAFPAFLVHMPVLTVLGTVTDRWEASGVVKTVVVGMGTIIGSWGVGGVGRWVWDRLVVEGKGKGKER